MNTSARELANNRIPRQVIFWDGENHCAGIMGDETEAMSATPLVFEEEDV